MLLTVAMLALAWSQNHAQDQIKPPWFYALMLTFAYAAFNLVTGLDWQPVLVSSAVYGVVFCVYFYLLEYFSEHVLLWWLVAIVFPVFMLLIPNWVMPYLMP